MYFEGNGVSKIENLEENMNDPSISRFIDTETTNNGEKVVDKEAKNLLENLKNQK